MKCIKCRKSKYVIKYGFRKINEIAYQRYKCKKCNYNFTRDQKFVTKANRPEPTKSQNNEKNDELKITRINKLREEGESLRKIAVKFDIALSTLQYFIKKHN